MDSQTGVSISPSLQASQPDSVLEHLAVILAENRSAYLSLGPAQAVFSVKAPEVFAFGESVDSRWAGMTPEERAEAVVSWIRRAAEYCREPQRRYVRSEPEEGKDSDE